MPKKVFSILRNNIAEFFRYAGYYYPSESKRDLPSGWKFFEDPGEKPANHAGSAPTPTISTTEVRFDFRDFRINASQATCS